MEERNINPRRQPGRREAGRREAPPQRSSSYQGSPPRYRDCRDEPARWRNDDWGDWDDWDDGEPVRRSGGSWAVSVLMAFYKVLVVLSIIVVAVYIGSKVFIRPPDQSQLPPPAQIGDASGDDAAGTAPPSASGLERRKGVYTIFLTATDKGGSLTDTMMLMTYDTKEQTVGVVSIPRDTLVARSKGNPHLVYGSGGVDQRIVDIANMLGVPIDFYIKVNINGFITLVDYLGGVDFYVPCDMNYDDPMQNLTIHYKEGQQHLNGQQALEVARFRKNNDGSGYTDVGRTQTQQKLLVALAKKVLSWNSLTKVNGFVEIFNENVDTNMSMNDMLYFASQGINMDPSSGVETATLEGRGDGVYRGYKYCYELDPAKTLETVNRLINPYTTDMTLEHMNIAKAQSYH